MAKSLFDLHREVKIVELKDDDGDVVKFGIKSPTHATHSYLLELLNTERAKAEKDAMEGGMRQNFLIGASQWAKDECIELILRMEYGNVEAEADLAPNADGAELTDEQKVAAEKENTAKRQRAEEAEAVKKRQERRKEQLVQQSEPELHGILADLQIRLAVLATATSKFMSAQLCAVIVEPEPPYKPLFELDPMIEDDQGHEIQNPKYIGHLQPTVFGLLNDERTKFFDEMSEKALRRQSQRGDFLPRGRRRNRVRGFRGAMELTPVTSPPPPSASSTSASG